jgi:predicted  nucleic acid-binding Zn-ribbon protein
LGWTIIILRRRADLAQAENQILAMKLEEDELESKLRETMDFSEHMKKEKVELAEDLNMMEEAFADILRYDYD